MESFYSFLSMENFRIFSEFVKKKGQKPIYPIWALLDYNRLENFHFYLCVSVYLKVSPFTDVLIHFGSFFLILHQPHLDSKLLIKLSIKIVVVSSVLKIFIIPKSGLIEMKRSNHPALEHSTFHSILCLLNIIFNLFLCLDIGSISCKFL